MNDDLRSLTKFDVGRVLERTFGTLRQNLVVFFLLSVLLVGVPDALINAGNFGFGFNQGLGFNVPVFGRGLPGVLLSVVGAATLQAALSHGTIMALNGRKADFGGCLGTGARHFLAVLGICILSVLGVGVGLLMLVIPGIFLMICWMVAVPVQVVERAGVIQSMSRSWNLTEFHRGMLLILLILYIVFMIVVGMLTEGLSSSLGAMGATGRSLEALVISPLVSSATAMITATGVAAVYFELRMIKEGLVPEELVSVFD